MRLGAALVVGDEERVKDRMRDEKRAYKRKL